MEAKWLEDFLALAQTRSFTRAAELCCSSQSAMSRRIQALERWVEAPLIDRDAHPIQLTEAGERFLAVAKGLRGAMEAARQIGRRSPAAAPELLKLLVQPDLHPSFLVGMFSSTADEPARWRARVQSHGVEPGFKRLGEGEADLLVMQQHRSLPAMVDPLRFQTLVIGRDVFGLYGATGSGCSHRAVSADGSEAGLPLLEYVPTAYFAQVAAMLLRDEQGYASVRGRYEVDNVPAMLAMVRAGHGVGFLPASWANDEVRAGRIELLDPRWQCELEVCVVREVPSMRRMISQQHRQALDSLWHQLEQGQTGLGPSERPTRRLAAAAEPSRSPWMPLTERWSAMPLGEVLGSRGEALLRPSTGQLSSHALNVE